MDYGKSPPDNGPWLFRRFATDGHQLDCRPQAEVQDSHAILILVLILAELDFGFGAMKAGVLGDSFTTVRTKIAEHLQSRV